MKNSLRYILPFLLTAAICITVLTGSAYVLYGDYSKRQTEVKFQAQFSSSQSQADQMLESILQYQQQLSYSLFGVEGSDFSGTIPGTSTLASLLNNFKNTAGLEASPAIFFTREPCSIYTSAGCISYGKFESQLWEENISPELSGLYSLLMTASKPMIYSAFPNNNKLIMILPLGSAWSAYPARLVMIMDQEIISRYFRDIGDFTSLYAMDSLGKQAFSSVANGSSALSSQILYDDTTSGIKMQTVNGKNLVFLRQASSTGLMTYIGVVPESVFYEEWYALGRSLLMVTLCVGILTLLLAAAMGYAAYRPVHHAYQLVTGETGNIGNAVNELDAIVETFRRTKENISELEDRQEIGRGLLRYQFTLRLINGSIKTIQEVEDCRSGLMMALNRPEWVAMFLEIPDETPPEDTDTLLCALNKWQCAQAELLYAECQWEKGIGIVINFNPAESRAEDLARDLADWLRIAHGSSILLGVGSSETSPLSVGTSFYRATVTVKRTREKGINGVALWQNQPATSTHLGLDTALLAEGISYGNSEVALSAFNELMLRIRSSHEEKPLICLMCSDILNTVVLYSQKQNLPLDKGLLCRAADFRGTEDFESSASVLISALCEESGKMRAECSLQTRSRVISFIVENYKRNDLSLKMLSDEMGMSMSKISILLKDKLGCSFVQYVSLLRLNEAKRLLRETNDSIQDIVLSVGYIDVSSFMRKFKQLEGIAPGQYRTLNRVE